MDNTDPDLSEDLNFSTTSTDISFNPSYQNTMNNYLPYNNNSMYYQQYLPNASNIPSAYGGLENWQWVNGFGVDQQQYFLEKFKYLTERMNLNVDMNLVTEIMSNDYQYSNMGRQTPFLYHDVHSMANINFPGLIYYFDSNNLNISRLTITISSDLHQRLNDYCRNEYNKYYELQSDSYPGPLEPSSTDKDDIPLFLDTQKCLVQDLNSYDWEKGLLLINYLELLFKHNGEPSVKDVCKLLTCGIEMNSSLLYGAGTFYNQGIMGAQGLTSYNNMSRASYSRASSRATSRATSRASSPVMHNINGGDSMALTPLAAQSTQGSSDDPNLISNGQLHNDCSSPVASSIVGMSIRKTGDTKYFSDMDKFNEWLLIGRYDKAVKFGIENNLWMHAITVALRLNNQSLVDEVVGKFCRYGIHKNDVLYTMHELFTERLPRISSLKFHFTTEWANWRSHLSMILSVQSCDKTREDICHKALESLGDKLMLQREYYSAHLCYLLAQTTFGLDTSNNSTTAAQDPSIASSNFTLISFASLNKRRMELIGWLHQPTTNGNGAPITTHAGYLEYRSNRRVIGYIDKMDFYYNAPEYNIKWTETYEYILKLRHRNYELSMHLLPYKYMMLHRMMIRGNLHQALAYCCQMGEILGACLHNNHMDRVLSLCLDYSMLIQLKHIAFQLNYLLNHNNNNMKSNLQHPLWLDNIDWFYNRVCESYSGMYGARNCLNIEQLWSSSNTTTTQPIQNQSQPVQHQVQPVQHQVQPTQHQVQPAQHKTQPVQHHIQTTQQPHQMHSSQHQHSEHHTSSIQQQQHHDVLTNVNSSNKEPMIAKSYPSTINTHNQHDTNSHIKHQQNPPATMRNTNASSFDSTDSSTSNPPSFYNPPIGMSTSSTHQSPQHKSFMIPGAVENDSQHQYQPFPDIFNVAPSTPLARSRTTSINSQSGLPNTSRSRNNSESQQDSHYSYQPVGSTSPPHFHHKQQMHFNPSTSNVSTNPINQALPSMPGQSSTGATTNLNPTATTTSNKLPPTKEEQERLTPEVDSHKSQDDSAIKSSAGSGGSGGGWLINKFQKILGSGGGANEVHLPSSKDARLRYDEKLKRFVDLDNPDAVEEVGPPPPSLKSLGTVNPDQMKLPKQQYKPLGRYVKQTTDSDLNNTSVSSIKPPTLPSFNPIKPLDNPQISSNASYYPPTAASTAPNTSVPQDNQPRQSYYPNSSSPPNSYYEQQQQPQQPPSRPSSQMSQYHPQYQNYNQQQNQYQHNINNRLPNKSGSVSP